MGASRPKARRAGLSAARGSERGQPWLPPEDAPPSAELIAPQAGKFPAPLQDRTFSEYLQDIPYDHHGIFRIGARRISVIHYVSSR